MGVWVVVILAWRCELAALEKPKKGSTAGSPHHDVLVLVRFVAKYGLDLNHDVDGDWQAYFDSRSTACILLWG